MSVELMKAMRQCADAYNKEECAGCPYEKEDLENCSDQMLRDAADAMEAAAAEIEQLRAENERIRQNSVSYEAYKLVCNELDVAVKDMKTIADTYREKAGDDGICGLCKQDSDHGLDGDAKECAGFYCDDCFEWKGRENT